MTSDIKTRLVGIGVGILVAGPYFAITNHYNIDPEKYVWELLAGLALVLLIAFLFWNRGRNTDLIKALTGRAPMIVQHADGHLSGKCLRCGNKVQTEPIKGPPYEYKCPFCFIVIQIHGSSHDA